jgi:hypothetical protein
MTIRLLPFNIILSFLIVAVAVGCATTGEKKNKKKEATIFRIHLETNPDGSDRNSAVPVYRERPVLVNIERRAFLSEGDIASAAVVEVVGGFAIQINFDRRGTWLLENVTTASRGRRLVIQSQFGDARWLAAPLISRRIADGVLVFTPDATREESERIVRGLNNIAKELKKSSSL